MYGRKIEPILARLFPDLARGKARPWEGVRDKALAKYGESLSVPDYLEGSLADGKNAIDTIEEALNRARQ